MQIKNRERKKMSDSSSKKSSPSRSRSKSRDATTPVAKGARRGASNFTKSQSTHLPTPPEGEDGGYQVVKGTAAPQAEGHCKDPLIQEMQELNVKFWEVAVQVRCCAACDRG
jgi:hypothetical protein